MHENNIREITTIREREKWTPNSDGLQPTMNGQSEIKELLDQRLAPLRANCEAGELGSEEALSVY